MRALGTVVDEATAAALKRARHKKWIWCRRPNGFSDLVVWRTVAQRLQLPLHQVQAFGNRLEELANASQPRGYVGDFSAVEFATATGMTAEEAARIYHELEHPDVAWIDQEHVATFLPRNPDEDGADNTWKERLDRSRGRKKALREIARQYRVGEISEVERTAMEAAVWERYPLRQVPRGTLPTAELTRRVTESDTARADHNNSSTPAVDNSGAATRAAEEAGLAIEPGGADALQIADAELWLEVEAVKIVTERMGVVRTRADTLVKRWRRDLDDDPVAIARVIASVADAPVPLTAPRFHVAITEHLRRCAQAKLKGDPLPLPPVRNFGTEPLKSTAPRHAVSPGPVDKSPAVESQPAPPRSGTDG